MIQKLSTLTIVFILVMMNFNCSSESKTPENLFSGSTIESSDPLVCTLTESELIKRKEALKEAIFSKVVKKEEVDNGYIFFFKDEKGMLSTLTSFIVEEQKCCTFFHYDISIRSNGKGIALKISGPLGAKMLMDSI